MVFDREYMRCMMKDHADDIAMFHQFAETGEDSDLKSWAAQMVPTLEEHSRLAMSTAREVGVKLSSMREAGPAPIHLSTPAGL